MSSVDFNDTYIMDRKDIVLKLAQIRQSKDISAYELSLRVDKAHNYIHSIESGKINPSLDSLLAICNELGIHPRELFN